MKVLFTSLFVLITFMSFASLKAQDKNWFNIYGFIMTDAGYDANRIDPDWFDVVRPTKLPAYKGEYGTDGNIYYSARQTRFGVQSGVQTGLGELFTQFEWELFGTGVDAGQTTIRLRHAYGQLGHFGVGQYWSPFMDIDVFPNSVEYWGPNGMAFFRNIQVRWMPIMGDTRLTFALERPGGSADGGTYAGYTQLEDVSARFPVPDFSAEYRSAQEWGYVELAGIIRYVKWEDAGLLDNIDLSGDDIGWGFNLSSNIHLNEDNLLRLSVLYGEGVENYMNDATVDVAIETDSSSGEITIKGIALPVFGAVAFFEHQWNEKFSSTIGWSMLSIYNSNAQNFDAFHLGNYALGNVIYYPVPDVMMACELQWGMRDNFNNLTNENAYPETYLKDANIFKVQFSFKYNFSHKVFF